MGESNTFQQFLPALTDLSFSSKTMGGTPNKGEQLLSTNDSSLSRLWIRISLRNLCWRSSLFLKLSNCAWAQSANFSLRDVDGLQHLTVIAGVASNVVY